jgi:glycosyltransferase involved in cell wall biosynthesis
MIQFSVVIPLYNKEPYIQRTIQSVLDQSVADFEIIVVDDGSSDKGLERVKSFQDSRIRLFSQENKGVSAARNKGIELARYENISFLDGDDIWKPDFLEVVGNLMEKNPENSFFATSFEKKERNGELLEAVHRGIPKAEEPWEGIIDDFFYHSLQDMLVSCSAVVVKKKVFDRLGGFMEGIRYGEDQEIWTRIAMEYPLVFTNYVGMCYDRDADNVVFQAGYRELPFLDKASGYQEKYQLAGKRRDSFWQYVYKWSIIKANFCIRMNLKKEAFALLWRSKKTRHFRFLWLATFMAALMPLKLYRFLREKFILK